MNVQELENFSDFFAVLRQSTSNGEVVELVQDVFHTAISDVPVGPPGRSAHSLGLPIVTHLCRGDFFITFLLINRYFPLLSLLLASVATGGGSFVVGLKLNLGLVLVVSHLTQFHVILRVLGIIK